jgi:hypothetical protein
MVVSIIMAELPWIVFDVRIMGGAALGATLDASTVAAIMQPRLTPLARECRSIDELSGRERGVA